MEWNNNDMAYGERLVWVSKSVVLGVLQSPAGAVQGWGCAPQLGTACGPGIVTSEVPQQWSVIWSSDHGAQRFVCSPERLVPFLSKPAPSANFVLSMNLFFPALEGAIRPLPFTNLFFLNRP